MNSLFETSMWYGSNGEVMARFELKSDAAALLEAREYRMFKDSADIDWKLSEDYWEGRFSVGDNNYLIEIYKIPFFGDLPDDASERPSDVWEVQFKQYFAGERPGYGHSTFAITGAGNANKVFGTMIKGIKQWVSIVNPKTFTIGAAEKSRQSLYRRMLSMILDDSWSFHEAGRGKDVGFTVYKKDLYESKERYFNVLSEMFDTSVPIKWHSADNYWQGSFEINGKKYGIDIIGEFGDDDYSTIARSFSLMLNDYDDDDFDEFGGSGEVTWNIEFYLDDNGKRNISIANTGDANKVFGTVIRGIKQWMDKEKPTSFMLAAAEPKRQRLYRLMLGKLLDDSWEVEDYGNTFYVSKKGANTNLDDTDDFFDYL